MFSKDLLIVVRKVLASAIRVMNAALWWPAQGNRHVEGADRQVFLHLVADRTTYHPAGMQIKDDRQINPALPRPDIGDVAGLFRCADLRF